MKKAICPGSFDPITLGHLDIIERAAAIFDHVVVAVMFNSAKRYWFSDRERVTLARKATAHLSNVTVDTSDKLLADYAQGHGEAVVVKGLRAISDFEHEFQMALLNRRLNPNVDTLFLTAGESFQYLSSSMVKEIGTMGGDIADFVPTAILPDILEKIRHKEER